MTLHGDADGEYRFSFIARDSDENVISHDSLEITEDNWDHNLPDDEYHILEKITMYWFTHPL